MRPGLSAGCSPGSKRNSPATPVSPQQRLDVAFDVEVVDVWARAIPVLGLRGVPSARPATTSVCVHAPLRRSELRSDFEQLQPLPLVAEIDVAPR